MLKGHFPALRLLGGISNIDDIYRVIHALMVLHNMCIMHHDRPEDIPDFQLFDSAAVPLTPDDVEQVEEYGMPVQNRIELPAHETDEWLREAGLQKREDLFNELIPP